MSMRFWGFVVFASSVAASSVFSATASQVGTTQDFINAAAAALGTDDSEALQLTSTAEQQKAHDYNGMWDTVDSSESVSGTLQHQRNATFNSSVGSSRTMAKLQRGKISGGETMSNSTRATNPMPVKTSNTSGNATTTASRSIFAGSAPSRDPVYDNWKLHLEKSLLHAVSHEASKHIASSRGSRFAPQTSKNSSVAITTTTTGTTTDGTTATTPTTTALPVRGRVVQAMAAPNHSSINSLVGGMEAAIKESASELKREQAETKREQAEAQRQLDEAKSEQAMAKHEQEEATRERLEAKRTLVEATRTADAAFSAGVISSSGVAAHSRLRPRRAGQEQEQLSVDASSGGAGAAEQEHTTVFGMPIREARSIAGGLAEHAHRQVKSSARRGVSWKLFGSQEWRPLSPVAEIVTITHGPATTSEASSDDLLNAELDVTFGSSALRGA